MSVNLTKFTKNVSVHQSLPAQPTISANELKVAWDGPANDIKDYLNNTLTDEVVSAFQDLEGEIQDALDQIQALLDALTAENVSYDNTSSGMSATNVQAGIDELKGITNSLSSSIGNVNTATGKKTVYSDFDISMGACSAFSMNANSEYNGTITLTKEGYYPIGVVGFHWLRTNVDVDILRTELTSRTNGRAVVSFKAQSHSNYSSSNHVLWVNVLWVKIR